METKESIRESIKVKNMQLVESKRKWLDAEFNVWNSLIANRPLEGNNRNQMASHLEDLKVLRVKADGLMDELQKLFKQLDNHGKN
ncbi:MAG: hypothetical protein FWD56_00430 [Bacteroidales bacterium]|nr:hypothetical protein [Bacteroidales bacterium]